LIVNLVLQPPNRFLLAACVVSFCTSGHCNALHIPIRYQRIYFKHRRPQTFHSASSGLRGDIAEPATACTKDCNSESWKAQGVSVLTINLPVASGDLHRSGS
jgi:hypothetical protein